MRLYEDKKRYNIKTGKWEVIGTRLLHRCKHKKGWHDSIQFLFWRIPVYICEDCMEIIQGKELEKLRTRDGR